MKKIQIAYNPVVAKIMQPNHEVCLFVSSLLSYVVEGHEHMDAFSREDSKWDGTSTFFDYQTRTFPAGFVPRVMTALKKEGYQISLLRKPTPEPLGPENPVVDDFGDNPLYDYQMNTVRKLEKRCIMIARIATGGGKSRIAKLAIARIARPTLFVTTRQVLMYQMRDSLIESGNDVGVIGDGEWDPKSKITCAMVQTLVSRLKLPDVFDKSPEADRQRKIRQKTIDYLAGIEFVIGEEAHEAGGNSYFEILKYCKNAHYRLALTATPFMKSGAESNMRLMACFSDIGIDVSEKLLIDRGILANPYFKIIRTEMSSKLRRSTPWQKAVALGITENAWRNKNIIAEAIRASRFDLSVMILVQRKTHGKLLNDYLKAMGMRSLYIFGDVKQDKRREAIRKLSEGEIDVLIGSTILDVGVDVPAVGMVILAGGGKAEVAHRQRIGRGLRAKKKGPNVCLVVDFDDGTNKHLILHSRTRRAILDSTPGFKENILKPGNDFNMLGLGFKLKDKEAA